MPVSRGHGKSPLAMRGLLCRLSAIVERISFLTLPQLSLARLRGRISDATLDK